MKKIGNIRLNLALSGQFTVTETVDNGQSTTCTNTTFSTPGLHLEVKGVNEQNDFMKK